MNKAQSTAFGISYFKVLSHSLVEDTTSYDFMQKGASRQ